jgi:CRISPR-associated protein Cas1
VTSLYVDRRGIDIGCDAGALVFRENGERVATVPIAPLERVYIRGHVRIDSAVLGKLGSLGVGVIILSGRRGDPTLFLPRPHHDARIRINQIRLAETPNGRTSVIRWLLRLKLQAHLELLAEMLETRPNLRLPLLAGTRVLQGLLRQIDRTSEPNALRGLEGAAAAGYFKAIAEVFPEELAFRTRVRRPPTDPVNSLLSLGYTMLTAEATLAAYGHGLDPDVGFLHVPEFGRASLACDLVEPVRPLIDRFAWRAFAEQRFRARDFSTEKDGACLLGKAGREKFYAEIDGVLAPARQRLDDIVTSLRNLIQDAQSAPAVSDLV